MYKLAFYVPESALTTVKNALFAKGAGRYKNYDCCAWQTLGQGQYRPLSDSQPFAGEIDQINHAAEYLVEVICQDNCIADVITELKRVHPYETPAFSAWKIELFND